MSMSCQFYFSFTFVYVCLFNIILLYLLHCNYCIMEITMYGMWNKANSLLFHVPPT